MKAGSLILLAIVSGSLVTASAPATEGPNGNRVTVAYGLGNHGRRIHVVIRYSIWPPGNCPELKPDSPLEQPDWKQFWSQHCTAYRYQKAAITLRIYRIDPPLGLALGKRKRTANKLVVIDPYSTGGVWETDVFTWQFQTGCYGGRYTIRATLLDPYGRPNLTDHARFVCR